MTSDRPEQYTKTGYLSLIEDGVVIENRLFVVHVNAAKYPKTPYYMICDLCGKDCFTTHNANLSNYGSRSGRGCMTEARKRDKLLVKQKKQNEMLEREVSIPTKMASFDAHLRHQLSQGVPVGLRH